MTAPNRRPADIAVQANLRRERRSRRITQQHVADEMAARGHSSWRQATVSEIENYGRGVRIGELVDLAEILDVSVESLLIDEGRRSEP